MRKIKVDVTQADIDAGKMHSCTMCPVALAISRVLRDDALVVGYHGWNSKDNHGTFPMRVADFINAFDEGYPVFPIQFELEILSYTY